MPVRLAIPKGSLEEATFRMLKRSWTRVSRKDRTYRVYLDDPDITVKMLRPQEIPTMVAEGLYDAGITGSDWVKESRAGVEQLLDLEYGHIRLVAAMPDGARYKGLDSMISDYARRKKTLRVSSEYLNTAAAYVKSLPSYKKRFGRRDPLVVTPWARSGTNEGVRIVLSFGATEAKPPEDVDAIIDVTETGTTLRQNGLRITEQLLESTARLVANRDSLRDRKKRVKLYDMVALMRGAVEGKKYLHMYVNVEAGNLEKLLERVPSLKRPTVSPLSEDGWYGVNTVILRSEFYKIAPGLRGLAQGIVVHEPRQILELDEVKRDEEE